MSAQRSVGASGVLRKRAARPRARTANTVRAWLASALLAGLLLPAAAQEPREFPPEAQTPDADALKQYLTGRVFRVELSNGVTWRVDYRSNGYFYLNVSTGLNTSGEWRAQPGQLCGRLHTNPDTCNDVRILGDALFYKRDNGDVVKYLPQGSGR